MSFGPDSKTAALADLSAMADGELDAAAAARACAAWRDDASARAAWHAYQLIGDVLRSDDLAVEPTRDAAFLASLRSRLAIEPIVLAPDPAPPSVPEAPAATARAVANGMPGTRRAWMTPSAVAAGFVLVAGALVVTRSPDPQVAPQQVAAAPAATGATVVPVQLANAPASPGSQAASEPPTLVVDGKLIRDARLDRYLAAHKQFAGSSVLGVPSGFLRNAAAEAPAR